tara:strand:- start:1394 stop:1660 length:267 start_codon:yes stop_codon:yes gene_type:complete
MQSSSTAYFQPTILAIAESRHYLVGVMDANDNFSGLGQSSAHVVGSLVAAKAFLRDNNIFSAQLELQTAYDEMCGLAQSGRYRERISF